MHYDINIESMIISSILSLEKDDARNTKRGCKKKTYSTIISEERYKELI